MRRFWLLLIMAASTMLSFAQDDNSSKYSVTTQMFLSEQRGDLSLERETMAEKKLGLVPVDESWNKKNHGKNDGRLYAAPDTINGKVYIAAYLRLVDASAVSEVEALGVVLQEEFNNGLWTSLIPVDKINDVAGITKVKRINVSPLKKTFTKTAREKTNVDDALTLSTDAISAGLKQKYDGTGVVLGIIDTGIDFNHIAFKDASGNSRIKQAYVYNGSRASTYTGSTITSNLTDDNTGDHGTHTSTTAGGSSVIVNGTTVTVTDDHSKATYGGMAPGADLYLAGINGLSSTYLDNAVKNMCNYADAQDKPLVVSNSWGSQFGPHDGTGDEADVYNSLFGDSHPNRVALFAASNDGGKSKDNEGGGYHLTGTASSSSPLRSILRAASYSNTDAGYYYYGVIANAWCRSTSVSSMTCKIYVLDSSTGAVKTSVTVSPTTNGVTVSGLSSYFSGTLYAFKDYVSSNKTQILLYTSGLTSKSTSTTTKNGSTYYKSSYTLAVEFAPSSGSATIDVWGGSYGYFTNHLSTSGYTWTAGSDDGCFSDEATIPNVISIGAYVSANTWKDYSGTSRSMADVYTLGDIAYFSSWGTAGNNPTGTMVPWISAPGARLAAGVNHNHTTSVDSYSYYGSSYNSDLVVNNTSNPYAMMEGTSMATPTAAGIVALWMQASLDENAVHKNLTVNDVKNIMKETAITDSYTTTGANKDHFGNGKIDALAGLQYILGASAGPTITTTPKEVAFEGYVGDTYTETVNVKGVSLTGNITASISGDKAFTIDKTSIRQSNGEASADITVTWKPTSAEAQQATLTLNSSGADDATVSITGTVLVPELIADPETITLTAEAGLTATGSFSVLGADLKGDVTATLNDANGVFSLSTTTVTKADAEEGKAVTVTFAPTAVGSYPATVTLTSPGVDDITITLSGTATTPIPTLTASEQTLTFSADINTDQTQTVTLSGHALSSDITVTLTDKAGVFTVSPTTISASEIANDPVVCVTFNAPKDATYTGTLTISSEGVDDITINLSATASDGGTASDPYLNIAKYATIDEAGWRTTLVNTLYKYTEYESDEVAWLTLPVYGAFVGAKYSTTSNTFNSGSPQKWIETNITSTNSAYAGVSWTYTPSNTDPYQGWNSYFTTNSGNSNGRARAIGYNARTNTSERSVTFYVTNTTAVKLLGMGANGANATYPASVKVYECTKKADGSLTASTTVVKSATSTSTSTTTAFNIGVTDLDASKIYKVVAGVYRGYLYEIGFQTPLKKTLIGDVDRNGVVDLADVKAIVKIILGKDTDEDNYDYDAADVNTDDNITIADVTALVNTILGK